MAKRTKQAEGGLNTPMPTSPHPDEITVDGVKLPREFPTSITLLAKLGSIALHAQEMISHSGHAVDHTVLRNLLDDPEVKAWMKSMGAYLPVKR